VADELCQGVAQAGGVAGQPLAEELQQLSELGRVDDLLTELPDVSAAQARCLSQQLIAGMSGRSGLPGWCSLVASPIVTETGHTGLNQSPAFSSLPIFDVSRSEP
jgi:hypothetical protein